MRASANDGRAGRSRTTRSRRSSSGRTRARRIRGGGRPGDRTDPLGRAPQGRARANHARERGSHARPQAAAVATARRRRGLLCVRRPAAERGDGFRPRRRDARAPAPPPRPARRGDAARGVVAAFRRRRARPSVGGPAVPLGQGSRGARGGRPRRPAHPRCLLRGPRSPARARAARHRERVAPRDAVPGPPARPLGHGARARRRAPPHARRMWVARETGRRSRISSRSTGRVRRAGRLDGRERRRRMGDRAAVRGDHGLDGAAVRRRRHRRRLEPEAELDETERKFRALLDALRWG